MPVKHMKRKWLKTFWFPSEFHFLLYLRHNNSSFFSTRNNRSFATCLI